MNEEEYDSPFEISTFKQSTSPQWAAACKAVLFSESYH